MSNLLKRLTYANVISTIALFLVLTGGAALAASHLAKNSVGTKQLKRNAITSAKVKNGAITSGKIAGGAVGGSQLANGAVSSAKIANNAVGGAEVNEASLQGLIKGNGSIESHAFNVPANDLLATPIVLANVPSFGLIRLIYCGNDSQSVVKDQMGVQVVSAAGSQPFAYVGHVTAANNPAGTGKAELTDMGGGLLSNEGGSLLNAQLPGVEVPGPFGIDGEWDIQLSRGDDPSSTTVHVSVSALDDSSPASPVGQCHISAQTTIGS